MKRFLRKNVILLIKDVDCERLATSALIREEFSDLMVVSVADFQSAKNVIEKKEELKMLLEEVRAQNGLPLYESELQQWGKLPLFNIVCIISGLVDCVNQQLIGNDIIKLLEKRRKEGTLEFIQIVLHTGALKPESLLEDILPEHLRQNNANINEIKLYLVKEHNVFIVQKNIDWKPYDLFIAMYPNIKHSAEVVDMKIEIMAKDFIND